MFSSAIRTSLRVFKAPAVVTVRSMMTCTNRHPNISLHRSQPGQLYVQRRTFLGPVVRVLSQLVASIGSTSIRAFFQAFQQAAAQADSNENNQAAAPVQDFSLKKGISIPESLQILNLKREDVNPTSLSEQFDKYFAANDPKSGGSFYLQSKVYRAHEALLDELNKYGYIRDESAKVAPPAAESKAETDSESKQTE